MLFSPEEKTWSPAQVEEIVNCFLDTGLKCDSIAYGGMAKAYTHHWKITRLSVVKWKKLQIDVNDTGSNGADYEVIYGLTRLMNLRKMFVPQFVPRQTLEIISLGSSHKFSSHLAVYTCVYLKCEVWQCYKISLKRKLMYLLFFFCLCIYDTWQQSILCGHRVSPYISHNVNTMLTHRQQELDCLI